MPTLLRVYANEDDALLFWTIAAPIPRCRGFAIERKIVHSGGPGETREFLPNRIGFAGDKLPSAASGGMTKPSTEWPFQRFSWTDHDANTGDRVSYRIVPMVRNAAGKLEAMEHEASAFSPARTLGAMPEGAKFRPFFNRGFVMSQFMARYLKENNLTLTQFKNQIGKPSGKKAEDAIRNFLSGDLRRRLLRILETAAAEGSHVYAALFELSDKELLAALAKLGKKAHVVLANGSVKRATGQPMEEALKQDENSRARAALLKAGVKVEAHDRFIAPAALGHNKFLVVVDSHGEAVAAWTGSTNWAPTGLCTQVNNGLLIADRDVAKIYFDQWKRLHAAKSDFPASLVGANSTPHTAGDCTVWFSRTSAQADLAALNAEVAAAKEGILFLMFQPGATGLLGRVAQRATEPDLYVRGVVSELPNGLNDESEADVHLVTGKETKQLHLDIIQPEGVQGSLSKFAAEVSHSEFRRQVGFAIIHSKVMVIDPFSDNPVVITGSHNFSIAASARNDENFVIVRGDKALAEEYAVNIEGAYQHYRWRAFLDQTHKPFEGLVDDDTWQVRKLAGAAKELAFWGLAAPAIV